MPFPSFGPKKPTYQDITGATAPPTTPTQSTPTTPTQSTPTTPTQSSSPSFSNTPTYQDITGATAPPTQTQSTPTSNTPIFTPTFTKPTSTTPTHILARPKNLPSTINTMTVQQYQQERWNEIQDINTYKADLHTARSQIDSWGLYLVPGRGPQTGGQLRSLYNTELQRTNKLESQTQLNWQQARDLDPDTQIIKNRDTYTFNTPDHQLDWTHRELAKIDNAYKINPILGGIAGAGFGVVSSIAATGKPLADYLSGGRTRQTHYVSVFDAAFEPLGLSPKGSKDILKRPDFYAGAAVGEIAQMLAFDAAIGKTGKLIGKGAKTLTHKTLSTYTHLSKGLPDEHLISKISMKLGNTPTVKNISNWSTKGYRKAVQYTAKNKILTSKIDDTVDLFRLQEKTVMKTTKYGSGRKIWLSPTQYKDAEKTLLRLHGDTSKYGRATYRIIDPTDVFPEIQRATTQHTSYNRMLSGPVKKSRYSYRTTSSGRIATTLQYDDAYRGFTHTMHPQSNLDDIMKLEKGGRITGDNMVQYLDTSLPKMTTKSATSKNLWYDSVKTMWKEGYIGRQQHLESGRLFTTSDDIIKGIGRTHSTYIPEPKTWITKARLTQSKNIWRNTQAHIAPVTTHMQKTILKAPSHQLHAMKALQNMGHGIILPSMNRSLYGIAGGLLAYGTTHLSFTSPLQSEHTMLLQRQHRQNITLPTSKTLTSNLTLPKTIQTETTSSITLPTLKTLQLSSMTQSSMTRQLTRQQQAYQQNTLLHSSTMKNQISLPTMDLHPSLPITPITIPSTPPPIPIPLPEILSSKKRSVKKKTTRIPSALSYRYREHTIGDLQKLLGG